MKNIRKINLFHQQHGHQQVFHKTSLILTILHIAVLVPYEGRLSIVQAKRITYLTTFLAR